MLNMLATLAEYERELIIERVNAGISAARQNGTSFGRPLSDPAVIADKLAFAQDARAKGSTPKTSRVSLAGARSALPPPASPCCMREHPNVARESGAA
jgi:DNA invertase Pin-like site-specific DNA recombinase